MMVSSGCRVHPVSPASAMEPAISERKRRLLAPENSMPSSENFSSSISCACPSNSSGVRHSLGISALRERFYRNEIVIGHLFHR